MNHLPSFYDPKRIGTLFYPDLSAIAAQAIGEDLQPATLDEPRVHLLIIDMQVDFCHESGALYVPGSLDDLRRLIEFIFVHGERITSISCSLDSHLPFQIFHPAWWVDDDGNHPEPLTIITSDEVLAETWRPTRMPDWSVSYVKELELQAKKSLVIWPYHVPIGGVGNVLDPVLWSAVFWHAIARQSQPSWWLKGSVPETEHYSILRPEIPVPHQNHADTNQALLAELESYDVVLIAGEAESHCLLETVEDLVEIYKDQPEMLDKLYILEDCTSPVQHPQVDFHALALEQFARFEQRGVHFITSTEKMPF